MIMNALNTMPHFTYPYGESAWNICWTHRQMFSVSTVLGEKASDVGQSWGAGAKLPGRRPPPHWTGRGPVNEGIMFCQLSVLLFFLLFFLLLFVVVVCFVFGCARVYGNGCVSECLSLQCHSCAQILDRGERCLGCDLHYPQNDIRYHCPSHQELLKPGRKKVIVEVVRKAIVIGKCWNICWTHLQMFSVSTVLGQKSSDVEQSRRASAKLPDRRPPPHCTGRGQLNESVVFGELRALLFVLGVCMGVWEWMCEWMSLGCHSCAQTLDRGERCLGPDLQCPR